MCICCCPDRKSLLIYAIVVTGATFIFGIITVALFGSSSTVHEYLVNIIDLAEEFKDDPLGLYKFAAASSALAIGDYTMSLQDEISMEKILKIDYKYLKNKQYGVIKSLKGIDDSFGVILFIFSLLLLGTEIYYLIYVLGIKESQVLSEKMYNIMDKFKLVTYIVSIASIFLSLLYGILLIVAIAQYTNLIHNYDSCSSGIVCGILYSFFSFWVYITLYVIFGKERQLFISVGSSSKPGTGAVYDLYGNQYVRTVISSQVVALNPQILQKPPLNYPYPNNVNVNIQQQQFGQIPSTQRNLSSAIPNAQPNMTPNMQYNMQPNVQPNMQYNMQPNVQPTIQPNMQTNMQPNVQPNMQPNVQPNMQSNVQPNVQPNMQYNIQNNTNIK